MEKIILNINDYLALLDGDGYHEYKMSEKEWDDFCEEWILLKDEVTYKDSEKHYCEHTTKLKRKSDKKLFYANWYEGSYVDNSWYRTKDSHSFIELEGDAKEAAYLEVNILVKDLEKVYNSKLDYEKKFKKLWKLIGYEL